MSQHHVKATIYDKKGRLLATGFNSYTKTHPRQAHYARRAGKEWSTYLHAEIAALIKAGKNGYSIHVERKLADGTSGLARPCEICWLAINEAGIKEVTYTV